MNIAPENSETYQSFIDENTTTNDAAEEKNKNKRLTKDDLEGYLNVGKTQHTRNKKAKMLESGKSPILTSAIEIKDFILNIIYGKVSGEVRAYGKVGNRLAEAIKRKRNSLETEGKYIELIADDLRESYKRHSSPKEKGDIPLTEDDFVNIPEYIDEFDHVLGVNEYNGKIEIHLAKETDDGYIKILTVSSKERESLQVTKIIGVTKEKFFEKYGKKIERDTGSLRSLTDNTENSDPSTTAQHTAGTLSRPTIPQNDTGVNNIISESGADNAENPVLQSGAKDLFLSNKNKKRHHTTKVEQDFIKEICNALGREVVFEHIKPIATGIIPDGYEVLKNRKLFVAQADEKVYDGVMNNYPEIFEKRLKKSAATKLLKKIGEEFGVFRNYDNSDVEVNFEFGKNNLSESVTKQKGNYDTYAKMLSCFSDVITNAVGIEVHNRNIEGYKRDITLKNVYVLCSAFDNGSDIVPVKLEIKEFMDKPNRLYVAVALESIKRDRVVSMGVPNNRSHVRTSPVTISIRDLFSKINTIGNITFRWFVTFNLYRRSA